MFHHEVDAILFLAVVKWLNTLKARSAPHPVLAQQVLDHKEYHQRVRLLKYCKNKTITMYIVVRERYIE